MDGSVAETARPSVVDALHAELAQLVSGLDQQAAIRAFRDGSATRELYMAFLVQTRHYVALTEPCLAAAGRRLRELGTYPELADLFFQKAEEESGHDRLCDDDLRTLGVDPAEMLVEQGPGRWVTAYNSWIQAATSGSHPLAFLGSAYLLEGLAVQRAGDVARDLVKAGGIPGIENAVTFLDLHAEADIGHVDDMDRILASLSDPVEIDAIVTTAAMTRAAYLGMLDEVAEPGFA